jgi:hypothetical protein
VRVWVLLGRVGSEVFSPWGTGKIIDLEGCGQYLAPDPPRERPKSWGCQRQGTRTWLLHDVAICSVTEYATRYGCISISRTWALGAAKSDMEQSTICDRIGSIRTIPDRIDPSPPAMATHKPESPRLHAGWARTNWIQETTLYIQGWERCTYTTTSRMLLQRGRVFKKSRQQNRQRAQADCFWADMYNIATLRNNIRIWTSSGGGLPGFHDDKIWKDRSYVFFRCEGGTAWREPSTGLLCTTKNCNDEINSEVVLHLRAARDYWKLSWIDERV